MMALSMAVPPQWAAWTVPSAWTWTPAGAPLAVWAFSTRLSDARRVLGDVEARA